MNGLTNCGFLDGASGWTKTAQLTLTVDEATRGSPGRAALVGTGTTSATNQKQSISASSAGRAVVTAGQEIEVSAWIAAFVGGVSLKPAARLVFYNVGEIEVSPVTLDPADPLLLAYGTALHGVRQTYYRAFARAVVPGTAVKAGFEVSTTPAASGAAVVLAMTKPLIGPCITGRTEALTWEPGLHATEDLQLSAWPDILQVLQIGPGGERLAGRAEFQAGPAAPTSRRTSSDAARRYTGQLRCDAVQRAVLDAFWSTAGRFWFVEPDTDRLCVASFTADGAPRQTEDMGVEVMMQFDLWLETA